MPAGSTRTATATEELAVVRHELAELRARTDAAQQLAAMGDYDWHIAADTWSWSDQLYRLFGYEPEEVEASYERLIGMFHAEDREAVASAHRDAFDSGRGRTTTARVVRVDGEVRHLAAACLVEHDEVGTAVRMRGTCVDVTDRVRAAEAGAERAAWVREEVVRRSQAFDVNDNIVQGISAAAMALQFGDIDSVATYLDRTLCAARATVGSLLLDPLEQGPATTGPGGRSGPTGSPVRVVVADDNHHLRLLLRMRLEEAGYAVVGEAVDGEQAVALTRDTEPDVVVLDLAMPDTDGPGTVAALRECRPEAKVIAVSGWDNPHLVERVLAAGASRFAEKGVGMDVVDLVAAVTSEQAERAS